MSSSYHASAPVSSDSGRSAYAAGLPSPPVCCPGLVAAVKASPGPRADVLAAYSAGYLAAAGCDYAYGRPS